MPLSRRALLAAAALAPVAQRAMAEVPLIRRPIPSSGETLPAIGIGTSRRYEVAPVPEQVKPLREAVETFVKRGGSVIDTAPSYGTAEDVLGMILSEGDLRRNVFLATKVDTRGSEETKAQIARSLQRLRTDRLDLVAVHNLIDTANNLTVLRGLKEQKTLRYVGVTVWRDNQFDGLEPVMRAEKLDFVQVNYAIDNRAAAERVLPLAAEKGIAVMVNVPFGRDRLFKAVQGKEVPGFAKEFGCATWPQFFLKYVLGHPAVTCPIPAWPRRPMSRTTSAPPTIRCPMPGNASRWRLSSMRFDQFTRRAALAFAVLSLAATPAFAQDKAAKIRIGVIGGGNIGGTIGGLWVKDGHEVMFASRHPEQLKPLVDELGPKAKAGTPEEAIKFGDAVFLAVPYKAYPDLSKEVGPLLKGKVVLDAGNATQKRDGELYDEVQKNGLGITSAKYFPGAKLVRAFSTANYKIFAKEGANGGKDRAGGRMAIPIAGDDPEALKVAEGLVRDAGFDPVVIGGLKDADKVAIGAPGFGHNVTAPELREKLGMAK